MKPVLLLHISELNNRWNKSVLGMVWRERRRMYRGPEPSLQDLGTVTNESEVGKGESSDSSPLNQSGHRTP